MANELFLSSDPCAKWMTGFRDEARVGTDPDAHVSRYLDAVYNLETSRCTESADVCMNRSACLESQACYLQAQAAASCPTGTLPRQQVARGVAAYSMIGFLWFRMVGTVIE
jgi:hypothetical protein